MHVNRSQHLEHRQIIFHQVLESFGYQTKLLINLDIEDVQIVSSWVLGHRLVKNYKAEAEGVTVDTIIQNLL